MKKTILSLTLFFAPLFAGQPLSTATKTARPQLTQVPKVVWDEITKLEEELKELYDELQLDLMRYKTQLWDATLKVGLNSGHRRLLVASWKLYQFKFSQFMPIVAEKKRALFSLIRQNYGIKSANFIDEYYSEIFLKLKKS